MDSHTVHYTVLKEGRDGLTNLKRLGKICVNSTNPRKNCYYFSENEYFAQRGFLRNLSKYIFCVSGCPALRESQLSLSCSWQETHNSGNFKSSPYFLVISKGRQSPAVTTQFMGHN